MMEAKDLSLAGIDGMRHLVTSEHVIRAVAFAVRHSSSDLLRDVIVDRTAYRFVVAASMLDILDKPGEWLPVLDHILALEREDRDRVRAERADDRPLLRLDDVAWYDDDRGVVRTIFHGSRQYIIRWETTGRETVESASDILSDEEHAEVVRHGA